MVAEQVRKVVSEYVGRDVSMGSSLEIGLDLCTGDILDLVIELESTFPVMIPDQDALRWVTVRDIADYIEPRAQLKKANHVSPA